MKTFFRSLLIVTLVFGGLTSLNADEKSHREAAEAMLNAMNMENLINSSIDSMLDAQVKASPVLAAKKDVMKEFLTKHMSWSAIKDDTIKIYTETFTEDEIKEITKFYNSPIGKKMVEKTPELTAKSMNIGTQRVQKNQGELMKMLQAK